MKMTNAYTRAVVWTLVCGQLTLAMQAMPVAADASHVAQMERYKWRTFGATSAAVPTALVPPPMQAALSVPRPVRPRRRITPNRTVPAVRPVPTSPVFSAVPTDQEIFRARIFGEPLVPVASTSPEENQALVRAISDYLHPIRPIGIAPFEEFLRDQPNSAWTPSLLANLGQVYLGSGRPSKALDAWERAWQATRNDTAPLSRAVADFAIGNWFQLSTNMGRTNAIENRLAELGDREVGGSAGAKIQAAREGLWVLKEQHELATGSGPAAINTILATRANGSYVSPSALVDFHAMPEGASLNEIQELANRVGLRLQAAVRTGDADIPVPAIMHLKLDHFSAIVQEAEGRYLVRDLIVGGSVWVTREALLQESSGYFLIPTGPLKEGWRPVTPSDAEHVIGHCAPGYPDDEDPCPGPPAGPPSCPGGPSGPSGGPPPSGSPPPPSLGMPGYNFMANRASLRIIDTPIGYAPPKGPRPMFTLTYVHREALQPQIFSFWNAGPKWTFDWLSYVIDNPGSASAAKRVYLRGGGDEQYSGADTIGVATSPHWRSAAVLVRTSSSPITYERRLRDGGVEVFGQSDGASAGARRIFLTQIIDSMGQSLTFTYDSSLRMAAVTDALGQVTTIDYELSSDPLKVTSVTDPFGRSAQLTYDSTGELVTITDEIGMTSSFTYGPGDFIAAMTTPYGITAFRHEPSASTSASYRMIEATDPLGATERLEFHWTRTDISSSESSSVVPTGFGGYNANLNKYNTFYWDKRAWSLYPGDISKATVTHWLITPQSDPFAYHGASSSVPHSIKKPLENRVWYAYKGQSSGSEATVGTWTRPAKTARVLDDSSSQVWQATYNDHGMITSETDPLGRQTSYTYDSNDIDLVGIHQTTGSLNDSLVSYADYTSTHQPETMIDGAGETSTFTYNAAGQMTTSTNPKNETTTYSYDTDGYLMSVTGPVTGATTAYTYDDYGRIATVTDSDGYVVTTEYDNLDRPTTTTYPDDTTEQITYERLDAVMHRDREGRITRTFFDALGRIVSVRDPLGRTVIQQWCSCGSLEKIIDPKGQATSWERDVQNRVTREIRADGTTDTEYSYETTSSRLHTITDPANQSTVYAYSLDDRVLEITFADEVIDTPDVSFTYDTNYSRLTSMEDGTGTTGYSYVPPGEDGAGQLASIDGPLTNDTLEYLYDELGRMTSQLIDAYGIASRTYDPLGRLTQEINELGTFAFQYDALSSRLAQVTYPNGQTSAYSYLDNSGDRRLQTIHHQTSLSATLAKFDYAYRPGGTISWWRQQSGSSAVAWQYDYDNADQLIRAVKETDDIAPAVLKRYGYAYDLAGNRSAEEIDNLVIGANYNSLNQVTTQQPGGTIRVAGLVNEAATVKIQNQQAQVAADNSFQGTIVVPSGTTTFSVVATDANNNVTSQEYELDNTGSTKTFSYSPNGNLASDGTRDFEWDARNELASVENGTSRVEFSYDGLRRRTRAVTKESGVVTNETRFVWCGMRICEERGSDGITVVRRVFDFGEQVSGAATFFGPDHLGNITEITNVSEAVTARYSFDPWGRREVAAGTDSTHHGFTGHYLDDLSGTWLAPFRVYDPDLGMWLSEDPLKMVDGVNLHEYVRNDPVRWFDPSGLCLYIGPPCKKTFHSDTFAACMLHHAPAALVAFAICARAGVRFGPWGTAACGALAGIGWGSLCTLCATHCDTPNMPSCALDPNVDLVPPLPPNVGPPPPTWTPPTVR
jgi:RHS repeat-associated protein